jgi:CheY-like chemotaxis protein
MSCRSKGMESESPSLSEVPGEYEEASAPRVLLVDDDKETCVLLRAFLEEDGIEVLGVALDGLLAASMVEQLEPDVVVMDQRMPGMDGLHATRKIKADHPDVEVILLTFDADPEQLPGIEETGAFDLLVKGCPPSMISDGVRRAWNHKREGQLPAAEE